MIRLGRRGRKGAPDTFDVDGYVALLGRLREQTADMVYAPYFNRGLEESIGSAVPIERETPLVVTEGNYMLLDTGGWEHVAPLLDETWFLDVPSKLRSQRLVRRREQFGDTEAAATAWVETVDQRNAALVAKTASRADLRLQLTTVLPVR